MAVTIRPLIAGNWKMNGMRSSLGEAQAVAAALDASLSQLSVDVMLAPPATLILALSLSLANSRLSIAGQDCHPAAAGAHTGDVSAEMLRDAGAAAVIVGHSERRSNHAETSAMVRAKAAAAHRAGMTAIICVGETLGERNANLTLDVVQRQLADSIPPGSTAADTVIAYEPVWAIGTGLTAAAADVAPVHATIRSDLTRVFGDEGRMMRILYGGSVKPDNAATLLAVGDVNGLLVGGASLTAREFLAILGTYNSHV